MKISSNTKSNSPVSELKHLTLSIDKGITNEVNQQIIKISDRLEQQWQQDKVLSTFVKMIRALSDYAASKKSNIHKELTNLIRSIASQMENLSQPPGINLSKAKKQQILSEEIAKYNTLKQQIKSSPREESHEERYQSEMSDNIISELKSIILSLDWEITDEIIQRLDREVGKLQNHWQNSKIHLSFLQMFKSIGNYVLSKGSNTHPDSISLLNSLYKNFELIALDPAMTMEDQKNILLGEMKKFNELKKTISVGIKNRTEPSFKAPPVKAPQVRQQPAISPMDDLIGTKSSSNLSPVDDLIEEIHMLQDSGTRTHSLDANTVSHGSQANPEIKEVIPNRLKKQPIPEIQTRLDAFFDEDESLSELSFADSGEEVVPYKGDSSTLFDDQDANQSPDNELIFSDESVNAAEEPGFEKESVPEDYEIDFEDDSESVMDETPFEDDTSEIATNYKATPSITQPSIEKSHSVPDGMVPYNFDDEFFDEDIAPDSSYDNQKARSSGMKSADQEIDEYKPDTDSISMKEDIQKTTEDIEILEDLKSTVAKCMFHGGAKDVLSINKKITALEDLWKRAPEKLILLKMVKSLTGYFDLLTPVPEDQTLELMLYIVESMENNSFESSGIKKAEQSSKHDLLDAFSRYIDFQSKIVKLQPSPATPVHKPSEQTDSSETRHHEESLNKPTTLGSQEIFYEQPSEEVADIENRLIKPKGFWSKVKHFLGF
ncbi:MAG: hypothetical protein HQK61_01675 [Desulfamplus sp.]|nr:hypothetical protein [Desulfamplus sp.]